VRELEKSGERRDDRSAIHDVEDYGRQTLGAPGGT